MRGRHVAHRESVGALLFGGLLGAGFAFMSAPRSGRESRQRVSEYAEEIKGKAECYAGLAKMKVSSALSTGKRFLSERKSIMKTAFEAGRAAYRKEKERVARERECGI